MSSLIPSNRKKFISVTFFLQLGAFFGAVNLFINDKLRADMENIIKSGLKREEMFKIHERIAGNYEKKTDKFEVRNQFNKYRRILLSYAKGKTLELGVGTGRSFEYYKEDADVVAVDYSDKMIELAKQKLDDRERHRINKNLNIVVTKMNCEDLKQNFAEGIFDYVVEFNNFQSYYDPNKVYEGIKHVLKDEGVMLFLARGESIYWPIKHFYRISRPFVFMKTAQDLTQDWSNLIEKDPDWEILYKDRKNYGRTYIYIAKLHKNKRENLKI